MDGFDQTVNVSITEKSCLINFLIGKMYYGNK